MRDIEVVALVEYTVFLSDHTASVFIRVCQKSVFPADYRDKSRADCLVVVGVVDIIVLQLKAVGGGVCLNTGGAHYLFHRDVASENTQAEMLARADFARSVLRYDDIYRRVGSSAVRLEAHAVDCANDDIIGIRSVLSDVLYIPRVVVERRVVDDVLALELLGESGLLEQFLWHNFVVLPDAVFVEVVNLAGNESAIDILGVDSAVCGRHRHLGHLVLRRDVIMNAVGCAVGIEYELVGLTVCIHVNKSRFAVGSKRSVSGKFLPRGKVERLSELADLLGSCFIKVGDVSRAREAHSCLGDISEWSNIQTSGCFWFGHIGQRIIGTAAEIAYQQSPARDSSRSEYEHRSRRKHFMPERTSVYLHSRNGVLRFIAEFVFSRIIELFSSRIQAGNVLVHDRAVFR